VPAPPARLYRPRHGVAPHTSVPARRISLAVRHPRRRRFRIGRVWQVMAGRGRSMRWRPCHPAA